jgi:hypothetical protein
MPPRSSALARPPNPARAQWTLAVLGALSVLPPYLGPAVGLELNVATDVEVVAHVLPGVAIALGGAAAALLARRGGEADRGLLGLVLVGWCFLGGLWQTTTHASLVLDGGEPGAPWGAVLLHSAAAPLITVIALWLTVQAVWRLADDDR